MSFENKVEKAVRKQWQDCGKDAGKNTPKIRVAISRGGKRKNAGRPKLGKVKLQANVERKTRDNIFTRAITQSKTLGEVLDEHFFEK